MTIFSDEELAVMVEALGPVRGYVRNGRPVRAYDRSGRPGKANPAGVQIGPKGKDFASSAMRAVAEAESAIKAVLGARNQAAVIANLKLLDKKMAAAQDAYSGISDAANRATLGSPEWKKLGAALKASDAFDKKLDGYNRQLKAVKKKYDVEQGIATSGHKGIFGIGNNFKSGYVIRPGKKTRDAAATKKAKSQAKEQERAFKKMGGG